MFFLFLCLLTGGLVIELVRKYILKIKDPSIEELWTELDQEDWYEELCKNKQINEFLIQSKENGLLKDPHYVRNIIDKEGHRLGFINYVKKMVKE